MNKTVLTLAYPHLLNLSLFLVDWVSLLFQLGNIAWTRQEEFAIQSTFYYGYLVTLPFAGRLADRFGGKLFFIHSVTIQAVLFMLIPTFAHITYLGTSVIRLLQGLVSVRIIEYNL